MGKDYGMETGVPKPLVRIRGRGRNGVIIFAGFPSVF